MDGRMDGWGQVGQGNLLEQRDVMQLKVAGYSFGDPSTASGGKMCMYVCMFRCFLL